MRCLAGPAVVRRKLRVASMGGDQLNTNEARAAGPMETRENVYRGACTGSGRVSGLGSSTLGAEKKDVVRMG